MVHIIIYKRRGVNTGFCMSGHAGYAQAGQDIVCAAVSVLSINTINAIEAFTTDMKNAQVVSNEENAILSFVIKTMPSHDAQLLLNTYELGIESILEDYKNEYISLKIEEV